MGSLQVLVGLRGAETREDHRVAGALGPGMDKARPRGGQAAADHQAAVGRREARPQDEEGRVALEAALAASGPAAGRWGWRACCRAFPASRPPCDASPRAWTARRRRGWRAADRVARRWSNRFRRRHYIRRLRRRRFAGGLPRLRCRRRRPGRRQTYRHCQTPARK